MHKGDPKVHLPWDILVFVTITTVGLGFSIQQLVHGYPTRFLLHSLSEKQSGRAIQGAGLSEAVSEKSTTVLDLGCLEKQIGRHWIRSEGGAIRVKGKLCNVSRDVVSDPGEISIRNITTGYEGTIFFQGLDNAFITDYLMVRAGKNVIRVEWKSAHKKPATEFVAEVLSR